ncbi:hypothetical protein ACFV6D_17810 [Kitasatospora sp. NPDC059812]|uniref:hypothetical protein n=1 Tax=Kitasatospora sp. NPDC059812 TaxID=3346958 RepID=UPI00365C1C84
MEVGTGTGWNAALLSHRLGSDNVVTVEVDKTSAGDAQCRLSRAEYYPTSAHGRFVGSSAFMRLRRQRASRPNSLEYLSGPWPADGTESTTGVSPDDVGSWLAMFAVGVQVPGVFPLVERYADGTYTLWLHDTAITSWATVDWEPGRHDYEVVQSGPRSLWDEVEAAWHWWCRHDRPGFDRFGLTVTPGSHTVWLDSPENPIPLRG